jgi:RNA polymerase sigma-B factor
VFAVTTDLTERTTDTRLAPDDPRLEGLSRRDATQLLLDLASTADDDRRRVYQDRVAELNLQVALEVARRYRARGVAVEDLEQVACLGLVKAVRGYDAGHATDFLSYAVPTIRGEVRRYFRDHGWTIRPPRGVQQAQARITAVESELCQRLGRPPRPTEIADHLDLDLDLVVEALAANGCFAPTSLDTPVADTDAGLGDRLGDEERAFQSAEARVVLQPLLRHLDRREKIMLEMRFFRGSTQSEIGEVLGITQMQVSRLLSALLARLRDELGTVA